ncbi:MAG TPA: CpsD/CapB family tyrosine-protein kinase [Terriglobia bacterium]|nr:CpsD/CapB family tyrosine-protein kinase [Terriglobia bacterium]
MSRNFELLERASRELDSYTLGKELIPRAERVSPPPDARTLSREELIKLVQRIFLLDHNQRRMVMFTAVENSTGCTSICAGAAETIAAQVDAPVCVMDANLRRPALHLCFGMENLRGLTDAVFKPGPISQYTQKLPGSNLWLLPCGSMASQLSAVIKAEHLQARINELRKEFAYILIDSPPVSEHTDAILLGRLTDGAVLVLESNATRREVARIAKEDLEAAQVRVLGAVLNKRTFPIPQFLYDRV